MSDRFLSVTQLAEELGIAEQTIYNRVHSKSENPFPIPYFRCGRLIRFERKDVEEFVNRGKTENRPRV